MAAARYGRGVPEVLVILSTSVPSAQREAVLRDAPPTQSISNRVFLATVSEAAIGALRASAGVERVLSGAAAVDLPALDEAESLFVAGWLLRHGEPKRRRGDGLDWDTPPMQPPDRKR